MIEKHKTFTVSIFTLERGQVFGEIEIVKGGITRMTNAVCSANAVIYCLDKQHFQ